MSAAEAEVLPPGGGPRSPGEGPGLEVAKDAEQLVLEEGLGSSWAG